MATISALSVTVPNDAAPKREGRPAHHLNDHKNDFKNPWDSFIAYGLLDMGKGMLSVVPQMLRTKAPPDLDQHLPVIKPTWGASADPSKMKATWLGHACFLLELPTPPGASRGPRILFDPVFSNRCAPTQWIGPARYTKPPCEIKEIPQVDAVVISHNHYDHLDTHTIMTLREQQPPPHIFAPLNNDAYFTGLHIPKTDFTCLDWWDARDCAVALPSSTPGGGGKEVRTTFRVTCTPAQHFTGRGIRDRFKTLWASWAVEYTSASGTELPPPLKVWFGGDTGYRAVPDGEDESKMPCCPAFKEIGERFGGFDLAFIPIGAYLPRMFMSPVHCAPQDSVLVFKDVKAKRALGMHWGTWVLTTEPVLDPPQRLKEECEKAGIAEGQFSACSAIGETVVV